MPTAAIRQPPIFDKVRNMVLPPTRQEMKELGKRLRQVRRSRGYSQIDIAEAAGCTRAAVSQWERGVADPTDDNLTAAARKLDVTPGWLRTGVGAKPDLSVKPSGRRVVRSISMPVLIASKSPDHPPFPGAIPEMEGGLGAADAYSTTDRVAEWWRFPPAILADLCGPNGRPRIYRVRSDSMEPTIKHGSYVVVDLTQRTVVDRGIYAIDNGVSVVLKRLFVLPNQRLRLVSDAEDRRASDVFPVKAITVIGRCITQVSPL